MFTISTKGDYGMMFMVELAKRYNKGLVSLSEFSKKKKISSNYMHQIVMPLMKQKLITSKEGISGGYSLRIPPQKISVLSIIEALEGPLAIVKCTGKKGEMCPSIKTCSIGSTWFTIQKEIKNFLSTKTLAHIINVKR